MMKKLKIHPFPVASDPLLAQWQSSVASIAKEHILNDSPDIDEEELRQKVMTHPMVQGANYHITQAEEGTDKLTLDHIKQFLPTAEKELNLEPEVHAYLSQKHFDYCHQMAQKHGKDAPNFLSKIPPAEFPYSDYAIKEWVKCAAIWAAQGNPIPSPYINIKDHGGPSSDFGVITIPENSKIAILGDFGTGQTDAITMVIAILQQLNPDFIIHLGDIYYSGTESECTTYVNTFKEAFRIAGKSVPVFSIPGNHEYYAGGWGYFKQVISMNATLGHTDYDQKASYFCLRTESNNWQFLGMDTGYTSVKNFNVAHPTHLNASYSPWLEFNEAAWHQHKLTTFSGNSVLLSHHQLYSASSVINNGQGVKYLTGTDVQRTKYLNENLLNVFQPYFPKVAGWFWGHEHSVEIFNDNQLGLRKGRLIGNSGYEEWQGENPYKSTDSPFTVKSPTHELGVTDISWLGTSYNFYNHGFAMITLNGAEATTDYFEFPVFSPSSGIPSKIPSIKRFSYPQEPLSPRLSSAETFIASQTEDENDTFTSNGPSTGNPLLAIQSVDEYNIIGKIEHEEQIIYFSRPVVPEGYYSIGDHVQVRPEESNPSSIVVKGLDNDVLSHPEHYQLIWGNEESNITCWLPIPQDGYRPVGIVFQRGDQMPELEQVVCIREDALVPATRGNQLWHSEHSDFIVSNVIGNDDQAVACNLLTALSPDVGELPLYTLNANTIGSSVPVTREQVELFARRYAPKMYFNTDEKYLMTSVEAFLENAILVDKSTGTKVPATMSDLPTGKEHENNYYLTLKDPAARSGDLSKAKAYVHAKLVDGNFLDLQYWFLYAYNGPGTARVKSLVMNTTVHAGNSSLTPLGEHEGDWEHVTVRVNLATGQMEKAYFSQHADGQWYTPEQLEYEGGQMIVYPSLNGHASYPHAGNNYTEHRKYPSSGIPAGLEFFLINSTNKGATLNCGDNFELVSAEFLPDGERPVEPQWLNFLNRWGKSNVAHLTPKAVQGVLDDALGIFGKVFGFATMVGIVLKAILPLFVKEDQDGPTGPKMKGNWAGKEG